MNRSAKGGFGRARTMRAKAFSFCPIQAMCVLLLPSTAIVGERSGVPLIVRRVRCHTDAESVATMISSLSPF